MEATVNSYLLDGFAALVAEHGGDLPTIAGGSGIALDAFFTRDMQVPTRSVLSGFELAARSCQFRTFGLILAERSSLAVVEPLWPLLTSASTVEQMLVDLSVNFHVYSDRALVSLVPVEGGAMLQFDIMAGECESQVQIVEFSLALAYKEVCRQVGKCDDLIMLLFRHSRPADLSAHVRIFGPNLTFEQDCNAIFLDAALLEQPCQRQDKSGRALAEQHVGELRHLAPEELARRVESTVRTFPDLSDCTISNVSDKLGLSTRTLQRILAAEGHSFRQIVDDVRSDLARKYLAQSTLNIGQVAELLGYSEISAFSRAYRRWHGAAASDGRLATAVRRQNIWHNSRRRLAECRPRLGFDVKRRACGVASADARWSVV
ncbi:MAG: helix-turn-helix domain-containing protein [Novosphingobium sp.]|uniref:helix-turn-helix domain-containing protein n=1 Tax=Novosphingobium sp. TaxID=1874826 RepID=UPI0039193C02